MTKFETRGCSNLNTLQRLTIRQRSSASSTGEQHIAPDQPHLSDPVRLLVHDRPLIHHNGGFRRGRAIPQSTVWLLGVAVFPPLFHQDLSLAEAVENLAVEQFIAEPDIEAFAVPILLGRSGLDASGLGTNGCNPAPNSLGDELRPVARREIRAA